MFFEAALIASSLSLDALVASFAYGCNKIKIPISSTIIITFVCSAILGVSLLLGVLIRPFIPDNVTMWVSFGILFTLGIIKLFDSFMKKLIRKHSSINILKLYADPEEADADFSKEISPKEAVSLAVALSLDGLAVGFGAVLGSVNATSVFTISIVANFIAILLGCRVGNKIAKCTAIDLSWLSGVILIFLAVSNVAF